MTEKYTDEKEGLESSYITLRTMASDLEALRKSGGDISQISKYTTPIRTPQISRDEKNSPPPKVIIQNQVEESINPQTKNYKISFPKLNPTIKIIFITLIILLFFAFGYFVLPKILPPTVTKIIEPKITTTTPQIIR